jgi:hypothetical protein
MNKHKHGHSTHSQPQRDVFSIDVNDFNSSSTLYPITNSNKHPSSASLPTPPVGLPRTKITSGFKFNRCFIFIPLIAFLLVAIAATVCGVIFGIMYQPVGTSELIKSSNATEISNIPSSTQKITAATTPATILNSTSTTTKETASSRLGKF